MKKNKTQKTAHKKMTKKVLAHSVGLLRDGDNFEKEKAIDALIASPGKEVVEAIIPLLQEKNTSTRMAVLDVLKKIGSSHVDGIIKMLYDENEDIRVYGCEVLSFLKDPRAIPSLIDKLGNDAENVRNAACMALGDFDDEEAIEALLNALQDDEWVAFSAIYSVGPKKLKSAAPRLMEFFKTGSEELSIAACEALIEYKDNDILDEIFEILKRWDRPKRNVYLKTILEKGNEELFRKLKEKIGDELYEHLLSSVRNEKQHSLEIIRMLTNFKHRETCEAILDVLREMDADSEDYEAILILFASVSDMWGHYIEEYMKKDEKYLIPIVRACKIAGLKLEEAVLLDVYLSSSIDVKREIITGIPGIIRENGSSIVREAIKDTDGHIKGYAVDVAGALSLHELKDEIISITQNDFPDVRTKAIKTLLSLDKGGAMKLIKNFVYDGSAEDKKIYLSATHLIDGEDNYPFIEKLIFDTDENVRRSTTRVIGNFVQNQRYVDLLQKILKDDNISHEVLKVIRDKKMSMFTDRLIEIFVDKKKETWTRYYALTALGAFEDNSLFDIFVNGLKDHNGLIVIGCMRALADLNDKRAIGYIKSFTENSNEDVRSTAESVLEKLEGI